MPSRHAPANARPPTASWRASVGGRTPRRSLVAPALALRLRPARLALRRTRRDALHPFPVRPVAVALGQRLALARALLADPAVLLLDDCTSALDAETEARVREALDDLLPGRTRVIVSHKIESVRRADCIVVLDGGRIAEEGAHEELLARGGFYAEAHRLQSLSLVY